MLSIGIVGAENSHTAAIAKVCNIDKAVSARVAMVWGETAAYAKTAAEAGHIPMIVKDWRDMLGKVDGVMMDHRHPDPHFEVAKFYLSHGVPCFVDKPFTYTLAQGKELCALAKKKGVPVTSFSTIPLADDFQDHKKALRDLGKISHFASSGPADLKSKWGGVFFYGIHQVDAVIEALGTDIDSVELQKHGKEGLGILRYKDGPIVTMNCIAPGGSSSFHWSAVGANGIVDWTHGKDPSPYLKGAKTFTRMFKTGKEPIEHRRMLAPVAVLAALQKSLDQGGKRVKVAKF